MKPPNFFHLSFYSYLYKILFHSFSHIDLSFLARLLHTSSSSVCIIGELLKSLELIDELPLINNLGLITKSLSFFFIGFNIAEFSTSVMYFEYVLFKYPNQSMPLSFSGNESILNMSNANVLN
jgi:hypothetical protein